MDKTAALERLTKLESEAAELRKIIEQPEEVVLWVPKYGDVCFYVTAKGIVSTFAFWGGASQTESAYS